MMLNHPCHLPLSFPLNGTVNSLLISFLCHESKEVLVYLMFYHLKKVRVLSIYVHINH